MALRDKPAATAPAFESEDAAGQAPAETKKAETSTERAVTPAPSRAISPLSAGTVLKQLQNAIPTTELENLGIGVFPRITVGLDGFSRDKTVELGKKIAIEVLSWSYVWLVTTGEQNNDEANKLIRSSYDGHSLKGGEGSVEEYVKYLKSEGYDKSQVKQYAEVYCNLLWSEVKGDVAADEQEIVQVSLSPQSVGQWGRYLLESGLRKAKGIEDSNVVTLTQEKRVIGSNKFGIAIFTSGLKK
jgi:hypothetical protein